MAALPHKGGGELRAGFVRILLPGRERWRPVHKRDISEPGQASKRGRPAFVHKAFIGVCDDRIG
jgi:hypothetical protein